MTQRLQVVSFDLDGTLVSDAFDEAIWYEEIPTRYAARHGLSFAEAYERVVAEYRALRGHPQWTDMGFWFARFALGDWREAAEVRRSLIQLYPETLEVLDALAPRYRLAIITQSENKFYRLKLEVTGLGRYLERLFATPEHFQKSVKDEQVYREVMAQLAVAPEEMLHVGDHRHYDYELPRSLGINALHLDRRGERQGAEVIHDLRELLAQL
jgi:putative hydrolase of the HAD superfamily